MIRISHPRSSEYRLPILWGLVVLVGATLVGVRSASAQDRPFGTLREQAAVRQQWLEARLTDVLPPLMRKHQVQMWIVAMREYNEDPVFRGLVSPTRMYARRRSIFVFYDRGEELGVERITLGGLSQGGLYHDYRQGELAPDGRQRELWGQAQWDLLANVVRERDPTTIAVDISRTHNFADGLSAAEWEAMQEALGPDLNERIRPAGTLPIEYLAIRLPEMLPVYRAAQQLAHEIIETAYSRSVIEPGVTTTEDVVWWMRQRVNDLGLSSWFQPSVSIQRRGVEMADSTAPVILPGDVLHCDFGLVALGLHTDTQHMAYVLRPGEGTAPAGLTKALHNANRLQDIVMEEMAPGRTGNEVLFAALERMRSEKIDGTVYTHPIGDHGHGAGPLIGLWDRQDGVPGRGDVQLIPSTWYAIELQAATAVPEWDGQLVRMMLEEDAELTSQGEMRWIHRRQSELHLVR